MMYSFHFLGVSRLYYFVLELTVILSKLSLVCALSVDWSLSTKPRGVKPSFPDKSSFETKTLFWVK